jgi:hypothetical protein
MKFITFFSTFIIVVVVAVNAKPQETLTDPQTPVQNNQTGYVPASNENSRH